MRQEKLARHYRGLSVFITGAASGIGLGLAQALAQTGARVVLTDQDGGAAESAAALIRRSGGDARAMTLDVTDAAAFEAAFARAWSELGGVDLLFNNAGIGAAADARDMSLEFWRRLVEINLMGVIHGVQAAWARMADAGSGHIVNTASAFGLLPGPLYAGYTATKHAVVGLSRALRGEGDDLGVRVTAVCPGFIRTRILDNALVAGLDRSRAEEIIPFRFIDVDDAVQTILDGVARNRARIVFPWEMRLLWWADRVAPWAVDWMTAKSAARYRKLGRAAGSA
ncbi:MAG: SDR family NAD(P)-dependent oxidoreductase [Gammaproteobacteria bacterium]